jgi:hypothetical protein
MILYEFLKLDAKVSTTQSPNTFQILSSLQGFLNLVKEWNPNLYNVSAVINAVLEHLLVCEVDKNLYLEALAILYSFLKRYDKSLSMYLK